MTVFFRLLEFSRPYRGRLAIAVAAMVVYGAASAGLVRQIEQILDAVLPRREELVATIVTILALYFAKGLGAYISGYLMTDVGQRIVRDIRDRLFRHILGQSAAFFSVNTSGRLMSRPSGTSRAMFWGACRRSGSGRVWRSRRFPCPRA